MNTFINRYFFDLITSFREWYHLEENTQSTIIKTLQNALFQGNSETLVTRFANDVTQYVPLVERGRLNQIIHKLQISKLVYEQLKQIISDLIVKETYVDLHTNVEKDLNFDHLDLIRFVARCEQIFGIQLGDYLTDNSSNTLFKYVLHITKILMTARAPTAAM